MNVTKAWILMGVLTALVVAGGNLIGGQGGATTALLLALAMNFFSYWFSDKLVLSMSGAKPLDESEAPQIYEMTKRLTERAGLPMPKLYVTPETQPNAFATGRNPQNAAVAFTQGILRLMKPEEIEGVLAHELSHVKNRDILIGTIAAVFAGAITWLASMARWAAMFGGMQSDDDESGNPLGIVGAILMMILAPIAASLIQMAISRSREYHADETAAELTGGPEGLARALEKLAYGTKAIPMDASPAMAHMYIANPLSTQGMMNLFSTHPPIEERVKRLRAMR